MKDSIRLALIGALATLAVSSPVAAQKLSVGIVPFDVVSVDGGEEAAASMAKLVRIEMIKGARLQPRLLTPSSEAKTPIEADEAAKLGQVEKVDLVLVGTILEVSTSSSSQGASSGGLLEGISVGGRLERVTAKVALHVELVDAKTAGVVSAFDVEESSSGTGVGADLQTTLGDLDNDASVADRSPLAKALREAAAKVTAEATRRTATLKPQTGGK